MSTRIITVIRLLQFYITGLLVPVLSLLFLDRGLSLSELAISFGLYSATTLFLEVPTGVLADLVGRKKTFQFSLIVYMLAFGVIYIGRSFLVLSIGNVLYGVSRALSSGSLDALIIDDYKNKHGKEKLPRIMSLFSITEAVGLALGSLSGGFLPVLATKYFKSIGKYDLNIILKIILLTILFVLVSSLIHENKRLAHEKPNIKSHLKESWNLVSNSHNIKLIFVSLIGTGVFLSAIELYWQPRFMMLLGNGSRLWLLGFISLSYFGAVLLGSLLSEKSIARFGLSYKHIYFVSKFLSGVAILLLAFQKGPWQFTVFFTLIYLFTGASNVPEGTIINMEITDNKRASILSINSLVFQLGALIGSIMSSIVVKSASISFLWIIAACVVLLSTIAIACLKQVKHTTNPAVKSNDHPYS